MSERRENAISKRCGYHILKAIAKTLEAKLITLQCHKCNICLLHRAKYSFNLVKLKTDGDY